ncbi:MAG: DMT family transporter [Chloroflexota bacterium]|nr:DMT family transporter [Chloroflexota bacterium]MDQ6907792.1 DMT family transporter [Chloroflexota bacterium]
MTREREGVLFCITAATAYSVTAIFAKLAYAAGVNVVTLLTVRYLIAAFIFWLLIPRFGGGLPPRATITRGLLLGMVFQASQTWLFGTALTRIDAALGILLLYAYPAMVTIGAALIGRERLNKRRVFALVFATTGVVLVVSGPHRGGHDLVGILLALGAAFVYTCTLLTSHAILRAVQPLTLAGLVATGAAITFTTVGLASGGLRFDFAPWGWLPIIGLALCASVLATVANYAGMTRVGPTIASILGTLEIPLGVVMATIILGERLGPVQVVGGLLVLSAIVLLQFRRVQSRAVIAHPQPLPTREGGR